ncbi:response regulator [Limnofasciculus baicalensis]|uniref:Circadian input-output histidine kinase CikA n=1 Tax=Limnofasciculus baicalensis BBK-W-15 TaxID=2699891 RepID=A0AAE3GQC2_9CYAN|nr:response regulator [Limnofasciculus baicalensis]MCP2728112.1 response regulator [Limnofasciculus baicalensis BBK-W-15]
MSKKLTKSSPTRSLSTLYIVALSTVALLSIAGQFMVQRSLNQQSSDSRTINIAGRQRMLSQKLTKASLAIQYSKSARERQIRLNELQEVINLWQSSHQGLQQGDAKLGLRGNNTPEVTRMFAQIDIHYQSIYKATKGLLSLPPQQLLSLQNTNISPLVEEILAHEGSFLQGMDRIVFQYDKEAKNRVEETKVIGIVILAITLIVLLLEAVFVFQPAVKQIRDRITKLVEAKAQQDRISIELESKNYELDRALKEAESATKLKSQFLASMSHEIRTPMNAVIGMTGVILDTNVTSEQREYLEIIRNSGEALLSIINDILDFSKIEAGKMELEIQPFNLQSSIEESVDMVVNQARLKELDIAYLIAEETPTILVGDVTRLRQILVNLLSNAVKFTEFGEVVVSVSSVKQPTTNNQQPITNNQQPITNNQKYYEFHFTVKDTGIGIPRDRINQLFQSFSQVDASTTRKYGGTGLGLAIGKHLSELMGGKMWVESEIGKGSTFHFTILAQAQISTEDVYLRESYPQLIGKRLLIIEDNETNRQIVKRYAEKWGMICQEAATATEAIDIIRNENTFDVGIVDMQMPHIDGLTLARIIQQRENERLLPLVMLTSMNCWIAHPQSEFTACLSKPIKPSQLYKVLLNIFVDEHNKILPTQTVQPINTNLTKKLPLRILLAEDNLINQKVALRILERIGYQADVVRNGLEVIDALRKIRYDVVLLDVQMPEMDGLETARYICQEWLPNTRPWLIAMTAGAMEGDRKNCLEAGMNDYISKPVKIPVLEAALERCSVLKDKQLEMNIT